MPRIYTANPERAHNSLTKELRERYRGPLDLTVEFQQPGDWERCFRLEVHAGGGRAPYTRWYTVAELRALIRTL